MSAISGLSRASSQAAMPPKRRVGTVTSNACTECRKKRSKCDGAEPCARCVTQTAKCVYEIPVRQTKDEMRSEIEDLRKQCSQAEELINHLITTTPDDAQNILQGMQSGKGVSEIYKWLDDKSKSVEEGADIGGMEVGYTTDFKTDKARAAIRAETELVEGRVSTSRNLGGSQDREMTETSDTPPIPMAQTAQEHMDGRPLVFNWSRTPSEDAIQSARTYGRSQILGLLSDTTNPKATPHEPIPDSWTNVTPDKDLVEHLMALYFCWEYPTFASLSKDHFLADFRMRRPRYCSPLLVNAMLALGCRFASLPEARADPSDSRTAGDHFFVEAKRLVAAETNLTSLPSIQALGLLSIREGSCGRDTESFYYSGLAIRLAVERGLHREDFIVDSAEKEVRRATFWGAFTLDQAWSLNLSKIPHLSYASSYPPKPTILAISEEAPWIPYTDKGMPTDIQATQPCNVHSVYKSFCELSGLIHQALYKFYSPQKRVTSLDLYDRYIQYSKWMDEMPNVLKIGDNFTPSVVFVHVYFQYALLSLFLPFFHLRLATPTQTRASSESPNQPSPSAERPQQHFFIPRDMGPPAEQVHQAATHITRLMLFYKNLYTLRLTPSMTPYIILMVTIAHLLRAAKQNRAGGWTMIDNLQLICHSVDVLRDMAECHGFAYRALKITKHLAGAWGLGEILEDVVSQWEQERGQLRNDSSLGGWKDWSPVEPKAGSTNLFVPWGQWQEAEASLGHGPAEQGPSLFAAFPLQGTPLMGDQIEWERDGFLM